MDIRVFALPLENSFVNSGKSYSLSHLSLLKDCPDPFFRICFWEKLNVKDEVYDTWKKNLFFKNLLYIIAFGIFNGQNHLLLIRCNNVTKKIPVLILSVKQS